MMMRMTDRSPVRTRLAAFGAAAALVLTACGTAGTARTAGSSVVGTSGDSASAGSNPASSNPTSSAVTSNAVTSSAATSSAATSSAAPSSAATSSAAPSSPPTSPAGASGGFAGGGAVGPDSVRGYLFSARSATGRDLAPGKPIALTFPYAAGTVSINAGCNAMGGKPTWTASTLTVAPGISTMMACIDPGGGNQRMAQEHWFSQWLSKGVDWKLTGSDLVLSAAGVSIVFVRAGRSTSGSHPAVPSAHPPLGNTSPTSPASTSVPRTTGAPRPSQGHPAPVVSPSSPARSVTAPAKSRLPGDSINPPPTTDH